MNKQQEYLSYGLEEADIELLKAIKKRKTTPP